MIAVIVASYERDPLLRRLLSSLRECPALADGMLVITNNGTADVGLIARETGWPDAVVLQPGRNLGCAGGVALALAHACKNPAVEHLFVLDDDAVVLPETPGGLREGLQRTGGALAVPMVLDEAGRIGWFPGLLERAKWRVIKQPGLMPEDYLRRCGPEPVRFSWSAWPAIMITREAVLACGLPMVELFYQGVDLEYTMRVTARLPGYFIPTAQARHLPPPAAADKGFYFRECAGLQNSFFIFIRLRHGRRALRHLPGNLWRFACRWGLNPRVFADMLRAFWWGAILAKPQGVPGYKYFQERWAELRQS